MTVNWQVCSLIVQTRAQHIAALASGFVQIPGCEVAIADAQSGQLILVLEASCQAELVANIESVRNVAGVLAVSLVYHQQDNQGEETP